MNSALHYSSASLEWNMPPEIFVAAAKVLGNIDLDPSSNAGQPNVPARQHSTMAENGLLQPWSGKIYHNPLYGRTIDHWVSRLVESHDAGDVLEAIALLPAQTDTKWFRILRSFPRCFIDGRLRFGGSSTGAPFPSAVFDLGDSSEWFETVFGSFGDVFAIVGSERRVVQNSCHDERAGCIAVMPVASGRTGSGKMSC